MGEVIKFPKAHNKSSKAHGVTMNIARKVDGKTVFTNLMDLSDEEFLKVLLGDAIMKEKQDLAAKYISQ